jgi:hypothetical protein
MARTTPPRPVDPVVEFPELGALARTAIRLHPRPGTPSVHDSSIGGPLLWPANEPWPRCNAEDHDHERYPEYSLADTRLVRRIKNARLGRWVHSLGNQEDSGHVGAGFTVEEQEILDRIETITGPDGPVAMVPVAQLYVRDIPSLCAPEGMDLLQVLWCPCVHDEDSLPATALFWRSAAAVDDILVDPPEPALYDDDLIPEPCTIAPEAVVEYPIDLDNDLSERLADWITAHFGDEFGFGNFGIAPGCKVSGYVRWGMQDPYPNPCPVCGAETEPLLTISSQEWEHNVPHWVPVEDVAAEAAWGCYQDGPSMPTRIRVCDMDRLIIRVCPKSPEHPHIQMIQ